MALLTHVQERHHDCLIVLGVAAQPFTVHDRLASPSRERMLRHAAPGATIVPLPDLPGNDAAWSARLDALIAAVYPNRACILYGSRASFLAVYTGRHPMQYVDT